MAKIVGHGVKFSPADGLLPHVYDIISNLAGETVRLGGGGVTGGKGWGDHVQWHAVDKIRRNVVRDGIIDRVDKSTLMQLLSSEQVAHTHISVFLTYSSYFHYVCVLNANALCERTDIRDIIFVNSNCKACVYYKHART